MSWASRRMRPRRRGRVSAGPVGMIPAGSRHGPPPTRRGPARRRRYRRFASRNPRIGVGHLLEAALADHQPVMRVRREGLVAGLEPVREPLRVVERDRPVETGADDEPGYVREPALVDRHARQHLAARGARLVRLLAEQVPDPQHVGEGQVPIVTQQALGERLPADERLAVDLRDLAQLVRPGRRAQLARQLGAEQDQPGDRHPFGRLEREQAAHPVADHDDPGAEPLERRDDVLRVGVERERRRVRGLRPEMVAQVERVALPAAGGEVAEVALPQPRAGELAMDEQERLATRAPLGQPRLDVDARARRARSRPCGRAGRSSRGPGRGPGSAQASYRACRLTTRAG